MSNFFLVAGMFLKRENSRGLSGEELLLHFAYEVPYLLIEYLESIWGFTTNRASSRVDVRPPFEIHANLVITHVGMHS